MADNGRKLSFDWSIRFDNLLVLIGLLGAIASFVFGFQTDGAVMRTRFDAMNATVARLEGQITALSTQVSALSTQVAVLASRLEQKQ